MPLVQLKVFELELTQDQTDQIIQGITDVIADATHEKLRDVTWVIVNEVKDGHWGVGGKSIKLEDVKRLCVD